MYSMDFPGGSVVKILLPSTQGAGSVPVWGAEILSLTAKEKNGKQIQERLYKWPTHTQKSLKKRISILQYSMGHPYTAIALLLFFF